jgi:fumarate reductase flavoprotein subunit
MKNQTIRKLAAAVAMSLVVGAALEELAKQVVAANSAEIDGVSGATLTTNGVKDAVSAALAG